MLNIDKAIENGTVVFNLEGRLNTLTASILEVEFNTAINNDDVQNVFLDMTNLKYISSAGLRVLLTMDEVMEERGDFKLTHVNNMIREVLEMTGVASIITVE